MSEWMNEWRKERINEGMKEGTNEWRNKINERINDDICLFFSTTDIDEVWDQSDWIISFSGENITDISEKKNIKKSDIKYFISGIKNRWITLNLRTFTYWLFKCY